MNQSTFKILVPTDFSNHSNTALHQAIHFAEITKGEIELLYVLHEKKGILGQLFNKKQEDVFDNMIEEKLEEQSKKYSEKHKLNVTYKLLHSTSIHNAIIDYAKQKSKTLIIMGKGSENQDQDNPTGLGSNSAKVIRMSKTPVITIGNERHSIACKSILLPLDLTKETRQKVSWGIKIAKHFNSKINVISGLWDTDKDYVVTKLNSQMKQVVSYIRKQGIECTGSIIESKNDNSLNPIVKRYIKNHPELDLAIIMTQQEDDFTEFFMGSKATAFISDINLPVLSIIPRKLEEVSIGF